MGKPFIKKRSKKVGLSPGSMIYVGEPKTEKVSLWLVDYDQENYLV